VSSRAQNKQLRDFGVIVGGVFAAIGVWPLVFRGEGPRLWALVLSGGLIVPALLLPRSLAYVYRVWMAASGVLGWLNTRVILSVIFYAVVTPMGFVMRRLGRDPMQRRLDSHATTYRIPKATRGGAHMTRQF